MKKIVLVILLITCFKAFPQSNTSKMYKDDFEFFWKTINDNYCYFDKKQIDWSKIKDIYAPQIDTVTSRDGFVSILEKVLYELYDHHCSLRTNTRLSRRLVPTGADIWAEFINGKPIITEVRRNFGAEKAGITAGMEIIAINDIPVNSAILPFMPHNNSTEARNFALRLVLAGDHHTERKITAKNGGVMHDYFPDKDGLMLEHVKYPSLVESKQMDNIGYIRVNNFLFDNQMIAAFDSVLNKNLNTKEMIIDLRETPSGGNTAVARAILGRFTHHDQFYQKHELYSEQKETGIKRSWEEIVSSRGIVYNGPLVILADHWTGSVSEGITIGFDGMKRATVIGTTLARLNGAVETFELPNTKIGFNITTERLYHINGLARELYRPTIEVDVTRQKTGNDVILNKAISFLNNKIESK